MNRFTWQVRVYYEDTDAVKLVYYANYLKFMERARTEWLRVLGFEQKPLRQEYGIVFVVRQAHIDFLKPAFFDDVLHISVDMIKVGKASIQLNQQVIRNNVVLCSALIKLACIDVETLRPQAIPPILLTLLKYE
jgi:acyl-CoA thioester hydrolase